MQQRYLEEVHRYFLFLKNCTVDVLQTIYYDAFFNIFFDQIRKQESGELKQI